MIQREKALDIIERYKFWERAARMELDSLNRQYSALLERLRACRAEISAYESARLSLEASIKEVQVCKRPKKAKVDIRQAISTLSKEEREELLAKLSAM